MSPGRLNALTDGVVAIVLTIMVLELKFPAEASVRAVLAVLPLLAAYLLAASTSSAWHDDLPAYLLHRRRHRHHHHHHGARAAGAEGPRNDRAGAAVGVVRRLRPELRQGRHLLVAAPQHAARRAQGQR